MAKEKEPEFVVTDRRKFTTEGDVRPGASITEAESVAPNVASEQPNSPRPEVTYNAAAPVVPEATKSAGHVEQTFTSDPDAAPHPEPPTLEEQQTQRDEYSASTGKIDDMIRERSGGKAPAFEMTFGKLLESLYFTALMQLGMVAPQGEQPRADIIAARQTIDTLALLEAKTKGNLSAAEESALMQMMFELRMSYVQLTNAITQVPPPKGPISE